jgi:dephospho-CoA kinase
MIKIAVTGGIACGKTTVGLLFEEDGVAVCDADDLARVAMTQGTDVFERVRSEFGESVVCRDGELNRELLGALVFADEAAREKLNSIVHPVVRLAWENWLGGRRGMTGGAAVIVPLLFEAGFSYGWDAVICVTCSEDVQLERLQQRGLLRDEAVGRVAAQLPNAEKQKMSDFVIVNNGTKGLLKRQALKVLGRILEK